MAVFLIPSLFFFDYCIVIRTKDDAHLNYIGYGKPTKREKSYLQIYQENILERLKKKKTKECTFLSLREQVR